MSLLLGVFPRACLPAEGAAASDPMENHAHRPHPPAMPNCHSQAPSEFYLNVAVVIKQYILQLQVPVDHTILQREDGGTEQEQRVR